jgi:rubrerythrin
MGKLSFRQVLDLAIAEEEGARKLYEELASRVVDSSVKDTLLFLAKEEDGHRELLVAYKEGRIEGQGLGMVEPIEAHIVEKFGSPEWNPNWGLKEVFLAAATKEKISYEFYEELASRHPGGPVKELLKRLALEELAHKEKMEYLYANTAFPQTDGG